jgi:hypothetical protein
LDKFLAFQTLISLLENPWLDIISSSYLENTILQIYEPVSTFYINFFYLISHTLKQRSAVPAPVASMLCYLPDQAKAFTAALCVFFIIGTYVLGEYTKNLLSLPPLAKYSLLGHHLSPQTSYL